MRGLAQPVMGVCRNPLLTHAVDMAPVPVGVSFASLKPTTGAALRCYRNGASVYPVTQRQFAHYRRMRQAGRAEDAHKYLGRAARRARNWQAQTTKPGDVLVWHEIPQGREGTRTLLQIAAVAATYITGGTTSAWVGAAFSAAAIAYNVFVPPAVRPQPDQLAAAANVFSTSLAGNAARIDQPIWRNCGVCKITPPFASQPYYEFVSSGKKDDAGRDVDADQFYFAVFAVGIGRNDPIRVLIGKTPISSFQDVLEANYLAPGVQPTRALCNVVTSTEVSGISLESDGIYAGGYVASQPTRKATDVAVDMVATEGLGTTGTGGDELGQPEPMTVSWRVEAREIDDYTRPIGAWRVLADETRTANTNTPQRWSSKYSLGTPARVEVRVVRTDIKDTNPNARSDLQWVGLRAYLLDPATLNADTAHYEVVMRASDQLSGQAQRDFSILNQGFARTWNPSTGWSCELGDYANYTATRNAAWYIADLWSDAVWGEGLPDERIDLAGLYALAQVLDARQDHFDYTFDTSVSAWDAAQLIASTVRAQCFRRYGVNTIARDELATLPQFGFSPRNTVPQSMDAIEALPDRNAADGYVIEFTSNVTWDIATVDCPCPGFTVQSVDDPRYDPALPQMTAPIYLRLEGIKGAKHAEREGLFKAATMALRTRTVTCQMEMQGEPLRYLTPVLWQPEVGGFGQSGDVAFWDPGTMVMGLTEPPVFAAGASTWLTLVRDDGSLTVAVEVTPGPTQWDVVLPAAPDFVLVLDDGARERPKFFIGSLDEMVKVTAITDGGTSEADEGELGAQLYDVAGFIDDERVHTADLALLPGPGDIQDPIDDGTDDAGGGVDGSTKLLLVRLLDHFVDCQVAVATVQPPGVASYTLSPDGNSHSSTTAQPDLPYANEWMQYPPVETADAALFEVMFEPLPGAGWMAGVSKTPNGGDTLSTWLGLGVTRSVSLTYDNTDPDYSLTTIAYAQVRVSIRVAATGLVQASRVVNLHIDINTPDDHGS